MQGFFKPENTITSEEASRDFETVLDLVDKYHIVLITRDEKPDIVAMGFHYFIARFNPLLPEEEYAKLKAMDGISDEPNTPIPHVDEHSADTDDSDANHADGGNAAGATDNHR